MVRDLLFCDSRLKYICGSVNGERFFVLCLKLKYICGTVNGEKFIVLCLKLKICM